MTEKSAYHSTLVDQLSKATGVSAEDVDKVLTDLALPETLDGLESLGVDSSKSIRANNLRMAIRVGSLLVAA